MRKPALRVFILIFLIFICVSCSSTHGKLQAISGSPDIAVIKDSKGGYWAFPGSSMKLGDENRITFTGTQSIAYCAEGSGPSEKIAEELMNLRNRATYSGGFGPRSVSSSGATTTTTGPDGKTVTKKEEPYSLDKCTVGSPNQPTEVEVTEIIYHGKDRQR